MWLVALVAGAACVLSGLLPWSEAASVTTDVAPVLAFLVGITIIAELADVALVFDVAAVRAARLGGGSARRLLLLVVILGTATTAVLSLDTTAVLLTPVVLALAQRLRLAPLPFAMAAVWLANTASLVLPVSNLTNLLAFHRLTLSPVGFAGRMVLPELAAVAVTTAVLLTWYRRELAASYDAPQPVALTDRRLFQLATLVCLALGPLFVSGVPVEAPALAGAAVLVIAFAWRRRDALRWGLVPWRLVLLVEGLFLAIQTASDHGLRELLRTAAGSSDGAVGALRTAAVGAGTSNLVNNLPAYRALELAVPRGNANQLLGLLLGTNVGPLILLWGSLATLLWRERCRARGLTVSPGQFAAIGLVGVPLLLAASWAALVVTG